MLAAGNEVVCMEVGGIRDIEKCQVATDPFVEPRHRLHAVAVARRREFDPPILDAIQYPQRWERRLEPRLVHPPQQLAEMHVDGL